MKNSKNKVKLLEFSGDLTRLFFVALFSLVATLSFAQSKTVAGTVVDQLGEAVIGANVLVEGTANGTITDIDGNFSLSGVADNARLQISFIGYVTQTVSIAGKTSIRVVLADDAQALDEVVVVGYGTVKKSDITGALTQVTEKQIKQRPVQNALQAMQGKAPGVDITSNNRPGELGEVRIRGNRSINAENDPLYVVDGIPLAAGSVADINPSDIASMEILKDASATAIYGSRGANGVVLITTKKGTTGKATINYDGTFTFSKLNSLTDWMDSGQLLDWKRSSYINGGTYAGSYGNAPDPDRDRALFFGTDSYMDRVVRSAYNLNADGTPVLRKATADEVARGYAEYVPEYNSSKLFNQNWRDLVTRTAFTHNQQVSLSAGSENSRLYISLGYLDQQSTMKDQDYERYTVNMNGEISPKKWLKLGVGINASHSIQNYGIVSNTVNSVAKDSYGLATGMLPYSPAYDEEGNILDPRSGHSWHNLLLNIDEAQNEKRYYGAMISSFVEIDLLPWLKWRTNFGTQYRNTREGSYYGDNFTNPLGFDSTEPNTAYNRHIQDLSWTLENLIFVNKTFNGIHSLGATLMQSAEMYRNESLNARAYEVTFPTSLWYNLAGSNTSRVSFGSAFSQQKRASYMARVNYSLLDKYLFTATGRYDGASMLAAGNKWDFFPSAAIAWKIDQEEFMESLDWVSQLKFRVGYGVTGNASVKPYTTTGSMTSSAANMPFGEGAISANTVGAKANVMPNANLGWEKTASTNVGIDFGFLNNRISGSLEYYIAKTSDLLLDRSIPITLGYVSVQDNVGKTQNRGWEVALSTVNIKTRNFTWRTDFTFSANKEKIVALADGQTENTTNGWFVGQPIKALWVYKHDRIWQNTEEDILMREIYAANGNNFIAGQAKIVDQDFIQVAAGTEGSTSVTLDDGRVIHYMDNGFGIINDDDKHFIGSFQPKWVGGLNTSFTYKNWELNSFIYARMGNMYYGLTQTYGNRVEKDVWSPENPGGKYPQPTTQSFTNYNGYQGFTKGNMVIVRNIALSYTLPDQVLRKVKANSAQVYVQVLNPFIFGGSLVKAGINPDDTTGWDKKGNTDTTYIGGQTNNTAITRSYVLGVRFGF